MDNDKQVETLKISIRCSIVEYLVEELGYVKVYQLLKKTYRIPRECAVAIADHLCYGKKSIDFKLTEESNGFHFVYRWTTNAS